jgi:hypothetical protein
VGKTLPILAILLSFSARADILDPPSLRCASVDVAGNVTLTWVVPPDPNNIFSEYRIYCSFTTEAGPYIVVGNPLVYGLPTFTHPLAGANTGPRYYFMTTVSIDPQPNESISSDTLSTIFLTVAQSTPLGSAVLDWNLLHDPPLTTTDDNQLVQLEFPQGTWSQVDQVDALADHYQQVISICEDSLTYRIAVQDQLGCVSYSSLAGDVFADVTAPTPPNMTTVSVDTATNQVVLDWDPSPEGDTDGYIIFFIDGNNNYIIDTIYGQNNTTYVWDNSSGGTNPESYTVAAFDTCLTGNPAAPNTSATKPAHTSIHATTAYDRCDAQCLISWTPYIGWDVVTYELYSTFNGGPPVLLATLPASTYNYVHEDLVPFSTYCYVVRAVGDSTDMRSLSNLVCQTTDYPALPQNNYLRVATVVADDHIVVVDSVDQSASVRRYRLERTNNGGPWEEVATQPGSMSPTVVFNDEDVQTALRSYTYHVIVEDSCGVQTLTSNEGTSILLIAEPGTDGVNRLRWNGYEQWAGTVSGYAVYRSIADAPFSPIAFTAPTEWETEDDVNGFIGTNGRFCYYVEAIEVGNASGIDAVSTSNIACAIQQEAVWVPNAFNAGSTILENSRFQPVVAFVDVKGYEFIIFNRWGQQIWSTTDVSEPWKGTVNGNYVPQGVYAYYVAVYNGAGKKFEERGTVTFLCCP